MRDQIIIEDFEVGDGRELLIGRAFFDIEASYHYDRDIGGVDGYQADRCEFTHMMIGGFRVNRDQLVNASSDAQISAHEEEQRELWNMIEMGMVA